MKTCPDCHGRDNEHRPHCPEFARQLNARGIVATVSGDGWVRLMADGTIAARGENGGEVRVSMVGRIG